MKALHITAAVSVPIIILSAIVIIILTFISHPTAQSEKNTGHDADRTIRVALLNGCGREGLASRFADVLRRLGYDVVNGQGDNADSYDFAVSVVVDRKGNRKEAERIADDLGISTVIIQHAADPYIIEDYEIILGRDWDTLHLAKEVDQE